MILENLDFDQLTQREAWILTWAAIPASEGHSYAAIANHIQTETGLPITAKRIGALLDELAHGILERLEEQT